MFQSKDANASLKKLDQNLLNTCTLLLGFDDTKVECLKTFIKCKPLVTWIQESMKGDIK